MALGPIKYRVLKQTHPRLNMSKILCLKALYYGGSRLLDNDAVLSKILTRYAYEKDGVYAERKRRAYYENVFAQVVNQISAGLAQDPIRLAPLFADEKPDDVPVRQTLGPDGKPVAMQDIESGEKKPFPLEKLKNPQSKLIKKPEPKYDQYWIDLMDDATPFSEDGSRRKTFDQVNRDAAVEALICGWSWLQADLPSAPEQPELAPKSLAEQEQSGGLRAYLVPWATECVIDWEEKSGQLLWVRTYQCEVCAQDPTSSRDSKTHRWVIWERDGWTKYEIVENVRNGQQLPGDEIEIVPVEAGTHSFGRTPWVRLDLCADEGVRLHLGDQIESLCRSYFNKQNGEAFQWVQYYFQQLYEFLGPEIAGIDTMVSDAQQDPSRAKRTRAPGEVQVRGSEDKAAFVGPDMSGASEGRLANQDMRDAIYRATAQMALSQDTSGAMLRRSAESKKQDAVAQEIVLGAIGKKVLTMANSVAALLAAGRGDKEPPKLQGYERFDITDADLLITRAAVVESMNIPSATYQIERKYTLAITDLGDSISEEIKKKIRQELEEAITQDSLMQKTQLPPVGFDDKDEEDEDEEDEDEEDEDEDEGEKSDKKPPENPFARKKPFA